MPRQSVFNPRTKTINIILMNGGAGDHMASLVAINYIRTKYFWVTPLVWVPDFLTEFANHVLYPLQVKSFSDMKGLYDPSKPTKTTKWDNITSPMKIHCLDYAFLKLADENPGLEHKNYLQIRPDEIDVSKFNLPKNYIVLTTGYTASVREFPAKSINEITAWAKGKGLDVVFLGQKQTKTGTSFTIKGNFSEEIDFNAGISLIDRTSLLEAAKIMAGARAVMGVDNGLLHVAGCTEVNIIGGFTTVSPQIRMPVRKNILGWCYNPVVPDSSLDCSFCQEKTNFLYGHDYKNCIYKDNLCVTQMTSKKFIEQYESIPWIIK